MYTKRTDMWVGLVWQRLFLYNQKRDGILIIAAWSSMPYNVLNKTWTVKVSHTSFPSISLSAKYLLMRKRDDDTQTWKLLHNISLFIIITIAIPINSEEMRRRYLFEWRISCSLFSYVNAINIHYQPLPYHFSRGENLLLFVWQSAEYEIMHSAHITIVIKLVKLDVDELLSS